MREKVCGSTVPQAVLYTAQSGYSRIPDETGKCACKIKRFAGGILIITYKYGAERGGI